VARSHSNTRDGRPVVLVSARLNQRIIDILPIVTRREQKVRWRDCVCRQQKERCTVAPMPVHLASTRWTWMRTAHMEAGGQRARTGPHGFASPVAPPRARAPTWRHHVVALARAPDGIRPPEPAPPDRRDSPARRPAGPGRARGSDSKTGSIIIFYLCPRIWFSWERHGPSADLHGALSAP
jgi:hypothetical protein